jgi:hypothetical protein
VQSRATSAQGGAASSSHALNARLIASREANRTPPQPGRTAGPRGEKDQRSGSYRQSGPRVKMEPPDCRTL